LIRAPAFVGRASRAFAALPAPMRGGLLALASAAGFATMSILIRHVSHSLHAFEIVFLRSLLGLLFMMPWLMRVGTHVLATERLGLYLWRGVIGVGGMLTSFTAFTLIPITQATALGFTAPIFATLGAALILRETVRLRRWTAIIIGFLGAMIILQPGAEAVTLGAVLALAGALFQATSNLMVKSLSRTERPETIVVYMSLFITPLALVPAVFVWEWPDATTMLWMVALAACGTFAHICLTRAFAAADLTVVLPFDFGRLPIAAAIAFLIFAEVPTVWTWVGGAVIFASSFYIARREAQLARLRRAAAPPPA